jgi:hypothetical protein
VSLTAQTERVHSDGAIPPGRKYFLLMLCDALGGHNHANIQAMIERLYRYTKRPSLREVRDALLGSTQVSLEYNLKVVDGRRTGC